MQYAYMASAKLEFLDRHEQFFEWTIDPPKEPGWYWAVTYDDPICIFKLVGKPNDLYIESTGHELLEDIDAFGIRCWLGPLPVPALP